MVSAAPVLNGIYGYDAFVHGDFINNTTVHLGMAAM